MNDNKPDPSGPARPGVPETADAPEADKAHGDLASHFIQRTDNDFAGRADKSLIGRDIPIEEYDEDELDEDGEPL